MRPGPSLDALSGVGVSVRARVHVTLAGRVLATDVPVEDVRLEASAARTVATKCALRAPLSWLPDHPGSPLAPFGQRLHVTAVVSAAGREHEVALEPLLITAWEERGAGVSVTALSLLQHLEEDEWAWPSSPPAGARLSGEAQRIAGHLPVVVHGPDLPISRDLQWGTSRTDALRDLCAAYGLRHWVGVDGCLHLAPRREGLTPIVTYSGRDLLRQAPRSSTPRRPNRHVVVGSGSGRDPARYTATATTTHGPYHPGAYGWVTARHQVSSATSQADVERALDLHVRAALSPVRTRSVEIALDPRLELGDVVAVATDDGESIVGPVTAISMPLDAASASMRIDLEERTW